MRLDLIRGYGEAGKRASLGIYTATAMAVLRLQGLR